MDIHTNKNMENHFFFINKLCYSAESSGHEQTSQKKFELLSVDFDLITSILVLKKQKSIQRKSKKIFLKIESSMSKIGAKNFDQKSF